MTEAQRQAAIDALLTVSQPGPWGLTMPAPAGPAAFSGAASHRAAVVATARRAWRSGETVTILGQALPWADVRQQLDATGRGGNVDREHGRRHRGRTARPASWPPAPRRPGATRPSRASASVSRRAHRSSTRTPEPAPVAGATAHAAAVDRYHDVPADELVLARAPGGTLAIYRGGAQAATQQHDSAFLLGLVGAVMTVCCTLALAAMLTGSL